MPKSRLTLMGSGRSDNFQTPQWPVDLLLSSLPEKLNGVVWEPACGLGRIVSYIERHGIPCLGTDILTGTNFLTSTPPDFDYIITNPPFTIKDEFLKRCFELGKPFALLLPLTALEGLKRQKMYREYGVQVLVLPRRPDFEFPDGIGFKKKPWFPCVWITHGFNFDKDLIFLKD